MKILFVHSPSDLYGASRSLLRLSTRLVDDGNSVLVVLPGKGPLCDQLEKVGVRVEICSRLAVIDRRRYSSALGLLGVVGALIRSYRELARLYKVFEPDLIHTNTSLVLTPALVAYVKRVPHVWHVREIFSDFPRLWPWYQWFMVLFSTRIICVSRAVAAQFSQRVSRGKIVVVHNGFPAMEFQEVSAGRARKFRERYEVNGHVLVGLVGRIKLGRKGQDVLLKAAERLSPAISNVKFVFIGSPFPGNEDHLTRFNQLVKDMELSDCVVYTGDAEDIKGAYAALDISVQSSTMPEAFSGVIIESMAMGKPVIASDCGAATEQIENGVTGLIVKPNDPAELASALKTLLQNESLRRRLGRNARERFLACFEFEPFYQTMRHVYDESVLRSAQ